jgi:hypothetical protein
LKHVLAFLLKDQCLDFLPDFLVRPELLRLLVVQSDDVQADRTLDHVRDATRHQIANASFDCRQQFSLADQAQSPAS